MVRLANGGKSKTDAIDEAGLSNSAAYRYEELAGTRGERAQHAAKAAAERYFASSRADRKAEPLIWAAYFSLNNCTIYSFRRLRLCVK